MKDKYGNITIFLLKLMHKYKNTIENISFVLNNEHFYKIIYL